MRATCCGGYWYLIHGNEPTYLRSPVTAGSANSPTSCRTSPAVPPRSPKLPIPPFRKVCIACSFSSMFILLTTVQKNKKSHRWRAVHQSENPRNPTTVPFLPWAVSPTTPGTSRTTSSPTSPRPRGMPSGEQSRSNMLPLNLRPSEERLLLHGIPSLRIRPQQRPRTLRLLRLEPRRPKRRCPQSRAPGLENRTRRKLGAAQRSRGHPSLRCHNTRGRPRVVRWPLSMPADYHHGVLMANLWLLRLRQPMLKVVSHNLQTSHM